ncbi:MULTISPECIES: Nramp family divalent metal transporter [Cryobacterium]|uniref:Nramp family divalent metal transporter n=1 Tax=Cryobacterium TaxID=69578 RepID=UPI000B4D90EB|nr:MULTISPECIES: Nramp family divalent metal transporter [Cryobacterium]ASD23390.1 divalent metal cation transporter [Cryobacterium sp. LW097]POH68317.1 divalent metal cation transporter MntH [Cryobacterium zongtaii]TFC46977.1 Mn(2+) uptake NRAMP transporter MntH [Cryobacterium sp. TMN-39-2]TFC56772.1 Mn(2+) uptake NRAMP transporter MntH [Cryobacterium sp. TMB1-7]TFC59050.1 Mn(2+) uptake NRAMP transporter MntH [Cryobacterium sp. TMB3-1-2]
MPQSDPAATATVAERAAPPSLNSVASTRLLWLLGPALVAGVAYLDPGNVASNMTAGARYGYLLVWVVVAGNLMAWLIQYLSAKLGIVTGTSLPEILGVRLRRPTARRLYWVQAELVAMATDLAEIIGGAVALNLLFGLPLLAGGVITGVISMIVLTVQTRRGPRVFERVIVALLLIITVGFAAGVFFAPPDAGSVLDGLVPRFEGADSVLLAASILGATIMPHAIYAHSALTRDRFPMQEGPAATRRLLWATKWDVTIAMAIAGTVNLAILLLAASALQGVPGTDSLEGAYAALQSTLGPVVATVFAIGLLASGLASTSVGAYAGAEIMHGLLKLRVPLLLRRIVTLIPALLILGVGFDPTQALVLSQVVLSFGIPFALIPLVWLTAQRGLLGDFANRWFTTAAGAVAAVLLVSLNAVLLVLVFTAA